jgi:hypothetical protein
VGGDFWLPSQRFLWRLLNAIDMARSIVVANLMQDARDRRKPSQ